MLYLIYSLNALLMVTLPIGLGLFLARRLNLRWGLFGVGAVTFVASQVVHLPLNAGLTWLFVKDILPSPPTEWQLLFNVTVLGLTAGLCEETARYAVYRWWIRSARTWREALMFGAGHGGIEAILLGALAGIAFVQLAALRDTDLTTLPLTAEQLAALQKQLTDYWAAPWYFGLLGAVERALALCLHLSLAVLVLQVFRRKQVWWLGAAILWHATVNAVALYVFKIWGAYWAEAVLAGLAAASLGIVFALRSPDEAPLQESAPTAVAVAPAPAVVARAESDLEEKLRESQFIQ
ncbi:MAG: YhfC family glutamic-type intramembrane protease [Chloroflexota bacterium]